MRLVIIGGSDAGISAGLRARQVNPALETVLLLADAFPNYSICGLPFYISGETPDWRQLAHRGREELEAAGLELLLEHEARSIDLQAKTVRAYQTDGQPVELSYDCLVIATGAEPIRPPIAGLELEGVHLLHTVEDSIAVRERVVERSSSRALVVGGGYIGLEMADALVHRRLKVTLVEQAETVMPTVDPSLGRLIGQELRRHGVDVMNEMAIHALEATSDGIRALGSQALPQSFDLVLVVVGVRPSSRLAQEAGLSTGVREAIRVNRRMETGHEGVYAAGDCVETWHRLLERSVYLPLGTTAHKQGRVAGENAAGGCREFAGSLGTQVVKVFDLAVARTGLGDMEAAEAGFDPLTVECQAWDHKVYYPGAHRLTLRVTGDRRTGRLLGAQIVGHHQAQVAKRIDIFANALYEGLTVDAVNDLDLSYTPPLGAPWDPVQVAAQEWLLRA
jgi:NADPH-dependent 2,4-dienoyl-CoA reductase/sulfur reductase-like enzyme